MTVTRRLTVSREKAGERLDRYLSGALPGLSRSRIQQLIGGGFVSVEGAEARPSARLKGNEEITVRIPPPRPPDLVPEDRPVAVLFEDDHLMVVSKPAGMVVHPAPGHPTGTLVHALLSRAGRLSGVGGVERPGIVHRLDRDTSGIIAVAKDDAAHAGLSGQLASRRMVRRYRGIVWGRPRAAEGTVRTRVGRHPVHRKRMAVFPVETSRTSRAAAAAEAGDAPSRGGAGRRIAVTHYRTVESFGGFSLLEFRLETGRTHQVRLHCAHLSCPIVGDDVYGRPRNVLLGGKGGAAVVVSRYLLHAFHLGFVHPVSRETMEFTVPDPPEFAGFRAAVLAAER